MPRYIIREIIPDKVYQRGQIMTWHWEQKFNFLDEHDIDVVVNFWAKIDVELSDMWYFHLPSSSADMVTDDMESVADTVANLVRQGNTVLILCEAGMTRSVWFSILLVNRLLEMPLSDARDYVEERVGRTSLKNVMEERIQNDD